MEPDAFADGERLLAAFSRWAAEQRIEEAARTRSRERSLRDQTAGEATWSGLLVDLGETGREMTLEVGRRRIRGRLVGVARDFCVVEQENGRPALIPTDRIVAIWKDTPASGSRFPHLDLSFDSAVAGLADERAPVSLFLDTGSQVTGELIGSGLDLVTVRTDSTTRRTVHLRTSHVELCELR
jgi:hypothetical protein